MTCKQLHRFLWLGWITLAIVVMIFCSAQRTTVKVEIEKLEVVEELQQQIQQLQVQQQTIQQNGN